MRLREICIDLERAPFAYEEFRLKEFERDRDGAWVDEIQDGNDHSVDAVRYVMMDDVLRGLVLLAFFLLVHVLGFFHSCLRMTRGGPFFLAVRSIPKLGHQLLLARTNPRLYLFLP